MLSPEHAVRAVRLLTTFFAHDTVATRRALFTQALGATTPDPCPHIAFEGPVADFATQAVHTLSRRAGRGQHQLALLLTTLATCRGQESDPDFYDLPRQLNATCALPLRAEEQTYLARLIKEIEEKAARYAPLRGTAQHRSASRTVLKGELAVLRHFSRQPATTSQKDYDDILTAFAGVKRAALLGAPGSGKSTTLRRLALDLARRAQRDAQAPIPLFATLGDWPSGESFAHFIARHIPEIGWALPALLQHQRIVLLLDGLNERSYLPADLEEVKRYATVVTCRHEDYISPLDLGLDTLTLEPLSPQRIRAAVEHWVATSGQDAARAHRFFWQLAGDEQLAPLLATWQQAGASEDDFWTLSNPSEHEAAFKKTSAADDELWRKHIPNPRSLVKLASNPFLLTMLFDIWDGQGFLPRNRGELFRWFVLELLHREQLLTRDEAQQTWHPNADGDSLLAGLAELAWRMQTAAGGPVTVTASSVAVQHLGEPLLKKALDATLLEGGVDVRFRHQLLQEYFTARALQTRLSQEAATKLWPPSHWWQRSGWEETLVLLAGFSPDDCSPVIRWVAQAQPETAAQCILESGATVPPSLLPELQAQWLPRLTTDAQPEARAALGRALGRLNLDNRPGVGCNPQSLPDIHWVSIPGGSFLYGEKKERRELLPFSIARYPITNAQYQAFLDASEGYQHDRWWQGLAKPERVPATAWWPEPNHPRETVSWYEAMAFCSWLSHRVGYQVTLPTEWQWERAARGTAGRAYPWGEEFVADHANTSESKIGRTSAVGIYPAGASPEGVHDLSGNVWEWCLNEYSQPARTQATGTKSRVLRGGSWNCYQEFARAECRSSGVGPEDRNFGIGFRVVSGSPIR